MLLNLRDRQLNRGKVSNVVDTLTLTTPAHTFLDMLRMRAVPAHLAMPLSHSRICRRICLSEIALPGGLGTPSLRESTSGSPRLPQRLG